MMAPCLVLLALDLLPGNLAEGFAIRNLGLFAPALAVPAAGARLPSPPSMLGWSSVALALAIAAFDLARDRLPRPLVAAVDIMGRPIFQGLAALHSGLVGDYVVWIAVGVACFSVVLAFG